MKGSGEDSTDIDIRDSVVVACLQRPSEVGVFPRRSLVVVPKSESESKSPSIQPYKFLFCHKNIYFAFFHTAQDELHKDFNFWENASKQKAACYGFGF